MENEETLRDINNEAHVNETISRDEERAGDTVLGLRMAEDLILSLPSTHEGRNQWLKLFGESDQARALRGGD